MRAVNRLFLILIKNSMKGGRFRDAKERSQHAIFRSLGTKTQRVPKITIIAKSLDQKKKGEYRKLKGKIWNTHRGCKLSMPIFEARAPVINGRRALPPAPQADIHPTVPLTR